MSRLRARCPDCRTLTAVALGSGYECHACGRRFAAGLVRVVRAWAAASSEALPAADLPLPYPDAARIDAPTLAEQTLALAAVLPSPAVVVGGCAAAHVGIAQAVAAVGRPGLVWLSGSACVDRLPAEPWRGALRTILSSGAVAPGAVVLLGPSSLAAAERDQLAELSVATSLRALPGVDAVVVALDASVLRGDEAVPSWREPRGELSLVEVEELVAAVARLAPVAALGITGLAGAIADAAPLRAVCAAAWS